jgi:putative RecB family exonuclease
MDIVADPPPDQVALELTGRPYLSYSAVTTYAACPLRWYFRNVMGLPEPTVSGSLLLGAGVHRAIERHFRALMLGCDAPSLDQLMEAYEQVWREHADQEVLCGCGDDRAALEGQARRILTAFRSSELAWPLGRIIGVEAEVSRALLPGVPQLLGRLDLVVDEGAEVVVTDFKTSRTRWTDRQVREHAPQLLLYHELARPLAGDMPVCLEFAVLTKTRAPDVSRHTVVSDRHRIERTKRIVARVWDAMQSGIVYPNPSPQQCATCPFRKPCEGWGG